MNSPQFHFVDCLISFHANPFFLFPCLAKGSKFKSILPRSKPDVTSCSIRNARAHIIFKEILHRVGVLEGWEDVQKGRRLHSRGGGHVFLDNLFRRTLIIHMGTALMLQQVMHAWTAPSARVLPLRAYWGWLHQRGVHTQKISIAQRQIYITLNVTLSSPFHDITVNTTTYKCRYSK